MVSNHNAEVLQTSFYVFLHFKSDNVPHLTPLFPSLHSPPTLCLLFNSQLIFISSYLSLDPSMSFSPVLFSMVFGLFPFPLSHPSHCLDIFYFFQCSVFIFCLFLLFPLLLLSAPMLLYCSSICVSGDTAAGAGAQLSAGGRASGGGMV